MQPLLTGDTSGDHAEPGDQTGDHAESVNLQRL